MFGKKTAVKNPAQERREQADAQKLLQRKQEYIQLVDQALPHVEPLPGLSIEETIVLRLIDRMEDTTWSFSTDRWNGQRLNADPLIVWAKEMGLTQAQVGLALASLTEKRLVDFGSDKTWRDSPGSIRCYANGYWVTGLGRLTLWG